MFTIRHIRIGGDEDILETPTVRYTPGSESHGGITGAPQTLWITDSVGIERPLTGGTIFVMNSSGKTVSRYDLGASPVPIVGDGLSDPRKQGVCTTGAHVS